LLRHYLSLALRNVRRSPVASTLNVLTLALGLACFTIAMAFVSFWQRAEEHFANADRVAVLTMNLELSDGSLRFTDDTGTPEIAATYIKAEFPSLERVARAIAFDGDAMLANGDQVVRRKAVAADAELLEILALPFVAGDPRAALSRPASAVVTEDLATRLFGTADALGRTLRVQDAVDAVVTGVIAPIPEPSHMGRSKAAVLPFDVLVSYDVLERIREARRNPNAAPPPQENWLDERAFTYLLLPHDGSVTVATLRADLPAFGERHVPKDLAAFAKVGFGAIPLRAVLGKSVDGKVFAFAEGVSVAGALMGLGTLVLVVACLNYANLATARAIRRVREVGLRKALGARPTQIMLQHLAEAALLTCVALVIAVLAFVALEPLAARLVGADLGPFVRSGAGFWAALLGATVAATVLAGAYPAFVLARVLPLHALRAARGRLGPKALATLLVGAQFAAASFLLIAVTITTLQNRHLLRTGLGTDTDPLVMIENPREVSHVSGDTLRSELARLPQVKGVTTIGMVPWESMSMTAVATTPGVDAIGKGVINYGVGYDFFSVFDIRILAGRAFSPDHYATDFPAPGGAAAPPSSEPRAIVVDRAFVEQFGLASPEAALDQLVYFPESTMKAFGFGAQPLRIIGVVDTKLFSFFGPKNVHATMYQYFPEQRFHVARIAKDDVAGALDGIDATWRRLAPSVAINRRFLSDVFDESYSTFARVSTLFTGLAAIAFAICVSGLFGMATLVAARRMPEIGVRKTLGAGTPQMIAMLLRGFGAPVLIANLLVWPFAYWAARSYLSLLLSPIELTAWPFVTSLLATLGVACVAVAGQTLRAARSRPADVLRYE
jgi:putative ABC transport system permease protein